MQEEVKPTPEEIKEAEEQIKNDARMAVGGLILRILWGSVILCWMIKSCNN